MSLHGSPFGHSEQNLGSEKLDILNRLSDLVGVNDADRESELGKCFEAVVLVGVQLLQFLEVSIFDNDIAERGRRGHRLKFLFLMITIPVYNQNQKLATMIQQRKNIRNYNDLLQSFATTCFKVVDKHQVKMDTITTEGLESIQALFQSYHLNKKTLIIEAELAKDTSTLPVAYSPKKSAACDEITYNKSSKKKQFENSMTKTKNFQAHRQQSAILSEKISKMNLGCDYLLHDENEDDEPTKNTKENHDFKNMSIMEIMQASNKKIMEKKKKTQPIPSESQSEYELTDYSSNQSSNDADYETHFGEEEESKPLFGGLFTKGISSQSSNSTGSLFPTLKFTSKQLLKSPKKQPKNKRLFVGSKKVPRWAEDLQKIGKDHCESKKDLSEIFGVCVVEQLDTNIIFEKQLDFKRTSSAKWNPRMFLD